MEPDPGRGARPRGRDDHGARPRVAGARRLARRPHRPLHHAGLRLPAHRCAPDELPSPRLDAPRARHGLRRRRRDAQPLSDRDRRALPLLLLRRRDAGPVSFEVTATEGEARAGVLRTAHGEVPTPAVMPVGTKATVKTVDPEELRAVGTTILLGNTYHLHFRPGEDVIAELGGLHRFMAWDGPILTDSGGFQVFSLRDTILATDDEGVTFRSVYDGSAARFTPELAAEIQAKLGSDIAMCLDVCPPPDSPREELEEAVRLTTLWGARQRGAPRPQGQLLFGIAQGATDPDLRRRSIEEIVGLGFDGHALGGLSVGEERGPMFEAVASSAPQVPAEKPRFFMGIGDPEGVLEAIEAGIDMFDCVLPTRMGRTGTAMTTTGRLNLKNARFSRDETPLEEGCDCTVCTRFSRAYIRHLVNQQELLGLRLLTLHNLRYLLRLTAAARAAVEAGKLASFKQETFERLNGA